MRFGESSHHALHQRFELRRRGGMGWPPLTGAAPRQIVEDDRDRSLVAPGVQELVRLPPR